MGQKRKRSLSNAVANRVMFGVGRAAGQAARTYGPGILKKILNMATSGNVDKFRKYGRAGAGPEKKMQRRRKKYSPQTGKSGGFFPTKTKRDPFTRIAVKGVVASKEIGCVVTGHNNASFPIYVGHATHSDISQMFLILARNIVKDIFGLAGLHILDFDIDQPGPYDLAMEYRLGDYDSQDLAFFQNTTGLTYATIAGNLATDINTQWQSALGQKLYFINKVQIRQQGVTRVIAQRDYTTATFTFTSKSDMKIQNRTLANGTDDDVNSTENVANQPLYGKSYSGIGGGLLVKSDKFVADSGKSLYCDFLNSHIAYSPSANQHWLKEPPIPGLFSPRPKFSKAKLEPSEIRTSQLYHVWTVKQSEFWKLLHNSSGGENQQNLYGKFRIFALEKMICATAGETAPSVGFEVNTRMGVTFRFKVDTFTQEYFMGPEYVTQENGV